MLGTTLDLVYIYSSFRTKFQLRSISQEYYELYCHDLPKLLATADPEFATLVFVAMNMWRAEQGSQEWLDFRRGTIGASEVSCILGTNKYKKIHEFAHDKVYGSEFKRNRATNWGNLLEDVIEAITASIFGDIYHTGSIPGIKHSNGRLLQTASPDGIGIISQDRLRTLIKCGTLIASAEVVEELPEISKVLYEFKVPLTRQPTDVIPEHYQSQIQTGMDTCHCDISIFGDCLLRKCSLECINFGLEYDSIYNKNWHPLKNITGVKYIGFVGFTAPDCNQTINYYDEPYNFPRQEWDYAHNDRFSKFQEYRVLHLATFDKAINSPEFCDIDYDSFKLCYEALNNDLELFEVLDLGDADNTLADKIIEYGIVEKTVYYSPLRHCRAGEHWQSWWRKEIQKFIDSCLNAGKMPYAIMPYKILDVKFILETKDPAFRDDLTSRLIDFDAKLKQIEYYNMDLEQIGDLFGIKRRTPRKKKIVNIHAEDDLDALFNS